MTWIVGAPTMFGYGFGISDVRVTVGSDYVDCLQKIYPIGRHFAAGFAGSVAIGFAMLDALRQLSAYEDEREACDPEAVFREWPACARQVFSRFGPEEQQGQCHLMLILVDPQAHVGNPAWPRSFVYIFKSPDFTGESVPVHRLGSIGSGNDYSPCRVAIESFGGDRGREQLFMQGEIGCPGGMASMLGSSLTDILKDVQPRGVSAHLHYCWVYRGQTILKTNNHGVKGRWTIADLGAGVNELERVDDSSPAQQAAMADGAQLFQMPRLANTWEELSALLKDRGLNAYGCTA